MSLQPLNSTYVFIWSVIVQHRLIPRITRIPSWQRNAAQEIRHEEVQARAVPCQNPVSKLLNLPEVGGHRGGAHQFQGMYGVLVQNIRQIILIGYVGLKTQGLMQATVFYCLINRGRHLRVRVRLGAERREELGKNL